MRANCLQSEPAESDFFVVHETQEIKPNMIELMKMKATFLQSEIQDGDILCFQAEPSEAE